MSTAESLIAAVKPRSKAKQTPCIGQWPLSTAEALQLPELKAGLRQAKHTVWVDTHALEVDSGTHLANFHHFLLACLIR